MSQILSHVFSPEVLDDLRKRAAASPQGSLMRRLEMLTASGPYPSEPGARLRLRQLRAERAALETYIEAADACGLLDADMLGCLRGDDPDNYRSARAEAMVAWLAQAQIAAQVEPRPRGRAGKVLDLRLQCLQSAINVEIKAPLVEPPKSGSWGGDDSSVIERLLRKANEKFEKSASNVLWLVPQFRTPVHHERDQLVKALIGQPVFSYGVDTTTGTAVGNAKHWFRPDGRLVRGKVKSYTRTSAVVTLEEVYEEKQHSFEWTAEQVQDAVKAGNKELLFSAFTDQLLAPFREDHSVWIGHRLLVCHNPFAETPLSTKIFEQFPQLVPRGNKMVWTDAEK